MGAEALRKTAEKATWIARRQVLERGCLRVLDITGCWQCTTEALVAVCAKAPHLLTLRASPRGRERGWDARNAR